MNFQDLHELLRAELVRRIERGTLTGSRLAQQAGFQQAHISNFLNRRRALSLEGLDRVLAAQNISIDQLLPVELTAAAQVASDDPTETVPVVSASAAMDDAEIDASSVIETLEVSATRLSDNRARASSRNAHWRRFVAIRADAQQAAAMEPMLSPGAIAVLDRHYNSLAPYRAHQPTLYAVRSGAALVVRFVDFDEGRLILRPYSRRFPVQLVPLAAHESPMDYLVGRVCLIFSEL
ncbi:helix-turn-helix transcriptional regulator [Edaphobacter sp.]|uniref:helix-turn-helix domain-containing protein n=1 Tax=Edaphobacter sp. TaxID=1934404 RepID=UPI002DB852DF|nr:helix-turn-helix transcriptional regulator [Edaphobacter sp.]HEU5340520.1 helix-turn-helix transcriptional regulator [Edaphobacter sp.]